MDSFLCLDLKNCQYFNLASLQKKNQLFQVSTTLYVVDIVQYYVLGICLNSYLSVAAQPPTVLCKMEAQLEHIQHCIHVLAPFVSSVDA